MAIAQLIPDHLNQYENIASPVAVVKVMKSPNATTKTAHYTITGLDAFLECPFLLENSHYNCGFSGKLHPRRP